MSDVNVKINAAPVKVAVGAAPVACEIGGAQGPRGATGVTGVQGATGARGVTGATGAGVTGATGVQGATGVIGVTGATGVGTTGATGVQGETGVIGVSGATGAIGVSGATGVVGVTGATGVVGVTGATGVGTTGATGVVGVTGATGVQGETGVTGATGVVGITGATGVVGVTGATGVGTTGATGVTGVTGATGVVGVTGATGVVGVTGATGVQGATGITGETGVTGVGTTGATGVVGVTGATGVVGVTGATGVGTTGATGVVGVTGATGAVGVTGATGAGTTGATGVVGVTGATGVAGVTGATGASGANSGFRYTFNDDVSPSDPGTGALKFDNSVLASALTLNISKTTANSFSIAAFLLTWSESTTRPHGTITITKVSDVTSFRIYEVDSAVIEWTDYDEIPILHVAGNGTFTNGDALRVEYVRTGDKGETGVTGATGAVGVTGATGVVGVTGATGVVGETGVSGATGVVGVTGATGVIGVTGVTGATGVVGVTGATGVQGETGVVGETGATGVVGVTGATGVVGVTGATGVIGETGVTGATGVVGVTGATGATGVVGVTGATGAVGVTGVSGATGVAGVDGVTGATGVVGVTGATGVVGVTGATGVGAGLRYNFSTNTAATDPTSGYLKFDNATLSSATTLYISETNADAINVGVFLKTWDDAPMAPYYATLTITKVSDPTVFRIYRINSTATENTGWLFWSIVHSSGNGSLSNNDPVRLECAIVGERGSTGATGEAGVTGATGVVGVTGATGVVGVTGATGVVGVTGATGVIGVTGATGVQGETGVVGVTGATGVVGVTGATGVVGVTGATGATGVVGVTGATGVGTTGATGVVGVTGATGPAGSGSGDTIKETITDTNTFSAGKAVYYNGSDWALSDNTAESTSEVVGIVESATGSDFVIVYSGSLTKTAHGFTLGAALFLSTSGNLTNTVPTTVGHFSKPVGVAIDANTIIVIPSRGIEIGNASGDVFGPGSSTDNALARFDTTTGKLLQNSGVTLNDNGEMVFPAGGTADAPIKLTAGTNLTTAEAGAYEYDGKVFYTTPVASARGVSPSTMFAIVPAGGFALSTASGVQSCFPAATDVWTLAASTTYFFEGTYHVIHSGTLTTAMAFALGGGASITSIAYDVISNVAAANTTVTANNSTYVTQVASTVVTVSTTGNKLIRFRGIIRMNAAGTVTPQINFSGTATSPSMGVDSWIRFTPIGTNTVASVGNVA